MNKFIVLFFIVCTILSSLPCTANDASLPKNTPKKGSGPKYGEKWTVSLQEHVNLEMAWCPAGTFIMGSPDSELGRLAYQEKQHEVKLTKGFWLGKYEVTQIQYETMMKTNPSSSKGKNLPVDQVSWNDAVKFCEKLTMSERLAGRLPEGYIYQLPTEAQWEYACRAGTVSTWNNGTDITNVNKCPNLIPLGWFNKNADPEKMTAYEVGQKQPNRWGLYDMHGNVGEWCRDWYQRDIQDTTDPAGPATVEQARRVFRGGCWATSANKCRSAMRDRSNEEGDGALGFRLSLTPIQK